MRENPNVHKNRGNARIPSRDHHCPAVESGLAISLSLLHALCHLKHQVTAFIYFKKRLGLQSRGQSSTAFPHQLPQCYHPLKSKANYQERETKMDTVLLPDLRVLFNSDACPSLASPVPPNASLACVVMYPWLPQICHNSSVFLWLL